MIIWFLYGRDGHEQGEIVKRGGETGGATVTSYLSGPPSSTVTKYRGGNSPEIAGSPGGFIGLIAGIVVVVVIGVFLGIYLYNRHRQRLPRQNRDTSHNPLPSLSFTRPSTDPYAEVGTPSGGGFSRPGYGRQKSYEWELPDSPSLTPTGMSLPAEPDGVALPLRRKSPRPISQPATGRPGSLATNPTSKGKGKERSLSTSSSSQIVNPFDSPYDAPSPSQLRHDGKKYLEVKSGSAAGIGKEESDDDDAESEKSIRITDVKPGGLTRTGTRFVERFESKESLV